MLGIFINAVNVKSRILLELEAWGLQADIDDDSRNELVSSCDASGFIASVPYASFTVTLPYFESSYIDHDIET